MPQVVSYAGVTALSNANNPLGYDLDTVGAMLNTIKDGLENDQTEDTATLVNIVANQTAIAGEKRFTGHLRSSKTALQISDNEDVVNLAYYNYKNQDNVHYYGNWSSSTAYVYNDLVWYSGWTFICKVANTNVQPDTDSTKWKQLTDVRQSYVDAADNLKVNITGGTLNSGTLNNCSFTGSITGIQKGDISIQTQNALDQKANISYVNTQDGLNVKYTDNYNKFYDNWSSSTTYGIGAIVSSGNNSYVSLVGSNLNFTPSSNAAKWRELGTIQSYIDTQDALKANITYVDSGLSSKASTTYVDNADNLKANITYVNTQDGLNVKYTDNYNKFYDNWSSSTTYGIGAIVSSGNNSYVSLVGSNLNFTPASNAAKWRELGTIQSYIDSGLSSKASTTYVDNADNLKANITYVDSQDTLNVKYTDNYNTFYDNWSSSTTYGIGAIVSSGNNSYVSLVGSNLNFTPASNAAKWRELGTIQSYIDSGLSGKASNTDLTNGLALKCDLSSNFDRYR